jgi:hypothetical protein
VDAAGERPGARPGLAGLQPGDAGLAGGGARGGRGPGPGPAAPGEPVRFAATVTLERARAWELCEVLADAERALRRAGLAGPAGRLGAAFDALEGRLVR